VTAAVERASVRFEPAPADAEAGFAHIVIDRPDSPVNAIDAQLMLDLGEAIRAARARPDLQGVIITSARAHQWVAGADLNLVTRASDPSQLEAASRRFQAVLDELAWLPCTSVAAIGGPALGGGLEIALACDYRVAATDPAVSLGQPEVNLGLVPAGGGTQRLPRLIGLESALDLLLTGRRLDARRARRLGLVDEVVDAAVLQEAARRWALRPKRALHRDVRWGLSRRAATELAELVPAGRKLIYRQARERVLARTHGHYPAPLKVLEAVEAGLERGMAAGLEIETRGFGELGTTSEARTLIWLFLASQRGRVRDGDDGTASVDQLGVVGAGFMGAAIAEVGAAAGLPVRMRDVSTEMVARGLATISRLTDDGVRRHRFDRREGRAILRRVSGATNYSGFARADLVIEAVFEDLAVKSRVLQELEAVVASTAVIASNTSAIPIRAIARDAAHPERVVGMHFFSPAQRMPLLEVVRPAAAADWAVAKAVALGKRLGKTVIVVADSPGFYTSRVLGVMLNEAALLLGEGARIADVDRAMTRFGFPVGPFVLYDEVGLEVAQHAGLGLSEAFRERLPTATIVTSLVSQGATGRKAGKGFYLWPGPSRVPTALRRFVARPERVANPAAYAGGPTARARFSDVEIQDRLVLLFVNEAVRCLEEGVLQTPTDGDLGAVLGLGFPPFLGGPFHYADAIGRARLADRLRALADRHGPRYEPSPLLVADEDRRFFPASFDQEGSATRES
jgi:3-hydroxyacyl-CoA dehydrogenase/enoyl-CoA hydratase/3-hydroxybutyryl-CoA epimerase